MKERNLVDIVAITIDEKEVGKPLNECTPTWHHGWIHPRTKMAILHYPPGMIMDDIPMQLNGIGENVRFGLIDVLEKYIPAYWDKWRSLS